MAEPTEATCNCHGVTITTEDVIGLLRINAEDECPAQVLRKLIDNTELSDRERSFLAQVIFARMYDVILQREIQRAFNDAKMNAMLEQPISGRGN